MKRGVRTWVTFTRKVAGDPRIPARDKAVLGVLLLSLASPVDLIPDFIPFLGYLDDLVVVAIVLDYVLNTIPMDVLMDHYPGDERDILRMRRRTRWLSRLVPRWIKRRIWAA